MPLVKTAEWAKSAAPDLPKILDAGGTQSAKIAEKVHKSALAVNVINFESNGFNASIWVPWSHSESKKL